MRKRDEKAAQSMSCADIRVCSAVSLCTAGMWRVLLPKTCPQGSTLIFVWSHSTSRGTWANIRQVLVKVKNQSVQWEIEFVRSQTRNRMAWSLFSGLLSEKNVESQNHKLFVISDTEKARQISQGKHVTVTDCTIFRGKVEWGIRTTIWTSSVNLPSWVRKHLLKVCTL